MDRTNTDALIAFARGIIADPDPNTDLPIFDAFQCNTSEGDPSIADPDDDDAWEVA